MESLKPPCLKDKSQACGIPTPFQVGFFFFGLYLISVGTGGVKPCLQAFGADQFDEDYFEERKKKSSFFNWWTVGLCTGVLLAVTIMVYIQSNVGWNVAFSITTASMGVAIILFHAGMPFYRHKAINESPFVPIMQVLWASLRKHNVQVPSNDKLLYEVRMDSTVFTRRQLEHSNKFRFLDKAAISMRSDFSEINEGPTTISTSTSAKVNPWRLCTVTQVEEVKLLLQILPVWLTTFLFGVTFSQMNTLFIKQGASMDTQIGSTGFHIPPASFQVIGVLPNILILPIYDLLLVPVLRAMTGHERGITLLQRIGIGLFFSIIGMAVAALIEARRLRGAIEGQPPLTIFWLTPQYIIGGLSDAFVLVGEQEFFYDQVPDGMRSLGLAFYFGTLGFGSFLSTFLIIIVQHVTSNSWIGPDINSSHVDYYYWLLAILCLINLLLFLLVAHFYHYKNPKREHMHPSDDTKL